MKLLIIGIGTPNTKNLARRVRSGGESKLLATLLEWRKIGLEISYLTTNAYADQLQKEGLDLDFIRLPKFLDSLNINTHMVFILRIIFSLLKMPQIKKFDVLYSASDLYFDSLPSFFLSFRNVYAKRICCLYLLARKEDVKKNNCSSLFYIAQKYIIKILSSRKFKFLVLNKLDSLELESRNVSKNSIFITSGGVSENELNSIGQTTDISDLCFVGRFHMQKGIDLLFESLRVLIERKPTIKIAMVGGGDDAHLNKMIHDFINTFPSNLKVYRSVSRADALGQIKNSRVFLFPSTNESWGIVVAEALYFAKPVVMYDLDYSKEIFNMGVLRIEKFDTFSFAQSVLKLIECDDFYNEMSELAMAKSKDYTWQNVAKNELNFITKI